MNSAGSGDEFHRLLKMSEILEKIEDMGKYLRRAEQYYQNFLASINRGEIEKASEMLWGALSCYANALSVLIRKKSLTTHSETVNFLKELAKETRDPQIIDAVGQAQQLHANFYHGFIEDPMRFREICVNVIFLIRRLAAILQDQLKSLIP